MTITLKLNTNWQNIKQMLNAKYPFLTENDLQFENSDEQFLIEKLSAKLKSPIEEIQAMLLKMKAGVGFEEAIPTDVAVV